MRRRIALLLAALPLILTLGWVAAGAGAALAGGGCHANGPNPARPTEAKATTVKIDGCTFAPTITRVPAGTDVRFVNSSLSPHDIVGRDHAWGTDSLESGEQFSYRFATSGVYPYSCSLHPGMAGVVVVGSPAVAVDDVAQVAAIEPTPTEGPTDDATVPIVAVAGISLLAGAALGALGVRALARRNDAV
jgi:plastocyanin